MGMEMRNRLVVEAADGIAKELAEILSGHVFLAIVQVTSQRAEIVNFCRTPEECALAEVTVVVTDRISGRIG